jgi:hypothetical protein
MSEPKRVFSYEVTKMLVEIARRSIREDNERKAADAKKKAGKKSA